MPNFHADHITKIDRKCDYGSPIIEMCFYQFRFSLFLAMVIGAVMGVVFSRLFM